MKKRRIRAGRPPKQGAVRTITGRISQAAKHVANEMNPALWARIKSSAGKTVDERMATEVGRLSCWGELTNAQSAAAIRIGEIYRRFHRANDLKVHPRSAKLEPGFGSADVAMERMDEGMLERLENESRSAREAWDEVAGVLQVIPANTRQAVMDLCVFDTCINSMLLPDVRGVLDYMAQFWGDAWRRRSAGKVVPIQRPKPVAVAQIAPRRKNIWNVIIDAFVRVLRPDLDEAGVLEKRELFWAMKEREEIRSRSKA